MRRNRRSVKIQDVAKAAGVSVSTVSRVLNNKVDVAEETYQKVQSVISELGYASSLAARGMRSHHTHLLGLIIPNMVSPYIIEILRGVNQGILQSDYELIIYTNARSWTVDPDEEFRYVTLLNGSIVDALIVVTPLGNRFPSDEPLVVIDPNHETPQLPAVYSTNREGALSMMNYLTGLGHRRIGFITGRVDLVSSGQRLEGYIDGLADAGIVFDEALVQQGNYDSDMAVHCTHALLSLPNPPTAIFAANDMSAMGVYQAVQQAGLKIPDDISVAGFDNVQEATFLNPPLTTIDQSIPEIGRIAVEMAIDLIQGKTTGDNQRIITTRLIIRDSCRPLTPPG